MIDLRDFGGGGMSEKVKGKRCQVDVEEMMDKRVLDREAKITAISFE
jgi:hypothetical protein